ncbi:hypothetical protein Pyn_11759 [Prunus yedoensis var. nudiflora]|uniref:Chromosome segregation in meiosis protein 3 domain-containing protein n=1 Tax=Prunus yedoensis var. nudiflora TaxID=2094558 RepID=A0A314U9F6_PRUYE|nr:hypothetical protein Pyn_11759 [Prunus yedoensis var. nudiflora]
MSADRNLGVSSLPTPRCNSHRRGDRETAVLRRQKKVSVQKTRPKLTSPTSSATSLALSSTFLEVRDLGNLIGLYTEWHSRLLPYYSFDQFVHEMRSNRLPPLDKEELKTFFSNVVPFGNHSKDQMWHNLDLYFKKIGSKVTQQKHFKRQAQADMEQLMTLVQSTAELCHELHLLDRLDQDYWHRLKEDGSNAARRGDSLAILRADVKMQVKFVSSLKKKSLWSKTFEEVEVSLLYLALFSFPEACRYCTLLHLEIHEAFGSADDEPVESSRRNHKKLGPSGISLQYASIITQINTLEPSETLHGDMVAPSISAAGSFQKELTNQVPNNEGSESSENHMTDEQRERMKASRFKVLEKDAARRRQL